MRWLLSQIHRFIQYIYTMRTKGLLLTAILCVSSLSIYAQKKFNFKFYGQIRTDLFYNSRASQEMIDGLFYMYPLGKDFDADGKDLNSRFSGNFYALTTRFGVDVEGPRLGNAKTFAKIEGDFRGAGTGTYTIRMRHAYFQLKWDKSDFLMGQTWHPLFGEVYPKVLNIATGAPFQPFSRAPQIRYRHSFDGFQVIGALVWQSQFTNIGPGNVRSVNYIKNSCVPEIYAGINYRNEHWLAGVGIEFLSIIPRTQSSISTVADGVTQEKIYKTSERINSLSYEAYLKYTGENWFVSAKSVLGSNLTQLCMLGGYGVTSVNPDNGKETYSPIKVSSTWINASYGKRWKPSIFLGYLKNLGTGDSVSKLYGMGTDIDQLTEAGLELTYNIGTWMFGLEYTCTTAWYGNMNSNNGRISNNYSVSNQRIVGVAAFSF